MDLFLFTEKVKSCDFMVGGEEDLGFGCEEVLGVGEAVVKGEMNGLVWTRKKKKGKKKEKIFEGKARNLWRQRWSWRPQQLPVGGTPW